jgi:hypothetical protein
LRRRLEIDHGSSPAPAAAAFLAEVCHVRVSGKNTVYDFPLHSDALAMNDPQMVDAAIQAFLDVFGYDFAGFIRSELVQVQFTVDWVFVGVFLIGHALILSASCRIQN